MRALIVCSALLAVACGDSPERPTATIFAEGVYRLEIGVGLAQPSPGLPAFCLYFGRGETHLDIQLVPDSSMWRIQMPNATGPASGTLRGELTVSGTRVIAYLRGLAIDSDGHAVVFGSDTGDVALDGTVSGAFARGSLTGSLRIGNGQFAESCAIGWTLARR
jgi:hypothetical protein